VALFGLLGSCLAEPFLHAYFLMFSQLCDYISKRAS